MRFFSLRSLALAIVVLMPAIAQAGSPIFSYIADFGGAGLEGKSFFEPGYIFNDFENITPGDVTNATTSSELAAEGLTFPGASGDAVFSNEPIDSNVVLDISDGVIRIDFDTDVDAVGIEYAYRPQNVPPTPLSFVAYASDDTLLGSIDVAAGDGFFGWNSEGANNIAYVIIHDSASTFQVDNLIRGTVSEVPVPGAMLLGLVGFGLVGATRRRK